MSWLKKTIKKHRALLLFCVFGILNTVVDYAIYIPLYEWLGMYSTTSNAVSWLVSTVFAFTTNKPFVFESHDWSFATVKVEAFRFFACRFASFLLNELLLLIIVDIMGGDGILWKLITMTALVIFNYIGSKLFVFKNQQKK